MAIKKFVPTPPEVEVVKKEKPFNPPKKLDETCVVDGCFELKAPAQTYVCSKHVRSN